jgi:hypothetical protein
MRALTLTIAFMLFLSSQAGAEETVMVCKGDDYKKYFYKHLNPLIGSSSVQQKKDGRWSNLKEICSDQKPVLGLEMLKCKVEVYDSGAKFEGFFRGVLSESFFKGEVKKGDRVSVSANLTLDFEFGRRTEHVIALTEDGRKVLDPSNGEYYCEINENKNSNLKRFKGTIEGVFE